jgi:multiple sugar transport system substrate-binding protein
MSNVMTIVSRRNVLTGALAASSILAIDPRRAAGQANFDWQRFKGQHIEVFLQKGPRADLLQQYQKEFETLTGISVGSEQIPEQQQRQKLMIELGSGHPSFDVASVNPAVSKRLLGKSKWFDDLRPYLNDASLTGTDFDFVDFSKPSVDYATQSDGRMDMLMQNLDYQILYWNKEIFAAKGITYPATHAELLVAAKALNDPANGVAGMVARGMKNANTPLWTNLLLGYGLNAIDPDLTMHTQSPEAIGAATLYQQLLSAAGPVGVTGYNWYESQAIFLQGRAAMWMDACGFAQPLENPAMSRVVGKVGYGIFPAGPKVRASGLSADALGIPAKSANKMPAWLYLQWACGRTMMARQLVGGYGAPPRQSAFVAAKADPGAKLSLAWLDCVINSAGYAHPILPQIVAVTEFRDVFGSALTNMIGGADPASELKKATEAFAPILEKTEKT